MLALTVCTGVEIDYFSHVKYWATLFLEGFPHRQFLDFKLCDSSQYLVNHIVFYRYCYLLHDKHLTFLAYGSVLIEELEYLREMPWPTAVITKCISCIPQ